MVLHEMLAGHFYKKDILEYRIGDIVLTIFNSSCSKKIILYSPKCFGLFNAANFIEMYEYCCCTGLNSGGPREGPGGPPLYDSKYALN